MASYRMYMDFIGHYLPNSPLVYGGATYYSYLFDSGMSFGGNFPFPILELKSVPPTTTEGLACDHTFIYRKPFYKTTRIDGPFHVNMNIDLATNNASPAAVHITEVETDILAIYPDGTSEVLATVNNDLFDIELVGSGTATRQDVTPIMFGEISCKMTPEMLLGARFRTYGYKTTTSTNLAHYFKTDPSAKDVLVSLPYVGV